MYGCLAFMRNVGIFTWSHSRTAWMTGARHNDEHDDGR
jgi:hypothetical protein